MNNKKNTLPSFDMFGRNFQLNVIREMIEDKNFSMSLIDVLDKNYFTSISLQFICSEIIDYIVEYKDILSFEILILKIKEIDNSTLKDTLVVDISTIKKLKRKDSKFIKDKALDFCCRQNMKDTLKECIAELQNNNKESMSKIRQLITDASIAGLIGNIGIDYKKDLDYVLDHTKRETIPTGWKPIDDALGGGLGKGELGVIMAPAAVGKSFLLGCITAHNIQRGENVIHYTLENSDTIVGVRLTANICDKYIEDIEKGLDKEKIKKIIRDKVTGRLIIKQYSSVSATMNTFYSHIQLLEMKRFKPTLIIFDYADLISGYRSTGSGAEAYFLGKNLYQDLRRMAGELKIPIWTACLHPDTEIYTNIGSIKIKDLKKRLKEDSSIRCFSYDFSIKKIVLGKINSIYESGIDCQMIEVGIDNGGKICCTKNHKFLTRTGEYVEAQNLEIGHSLMPFNYRYKKGYMEIMNLRKWKKRSRFTAEHYSGSIDEGCHVHHKDHKKGNDRIDNLQIVTVKEHWKIHGKTGFDPRFYTSEEIEKRKKKISDSMKGENNPMKRKEVRDKVSNSKKGQIPWNKGLNKTDPRVLKYVKFSYKENNQERCEKISKSIKQIWNNRTETEKKNIMKKVLVKTKVTMDKRKQLLITEFYNMNQELERLITEEEFIKKTSHIIYPKSNRIGLYRKLVKINNHKVVYIKEIENSDVYNMEVETHHNFALSSGIIVKNSQTKVSAYNEPIITLDQAAESSGKGHEADIMLSFSRTDRDKQTGTARFYIAKSRTSADGITFPAVVNFAKGIVTALPPDDNNMKLLDTVYSNQQTENSRKEMKNKFEAFQHNRKKVVQ